jgi:hypothetical protein
MFLLVDGFYSVIVGKRNCCEKFLIVVYGYSGMKKKRTYWLAGKMWDVPIGCLERCGMFLLVAWKDAGCSYWLTQAGRVLQRERGNGQEDHCHKLQHVSHLQLLPLPPVGGKAYIYFILIAPAKVVFASHICKELGGKLGLNSIGLS